MCDVPELKKAQVQRACGVSAGLPREFRGLRAQSKTGPPMCVLCSGGQDGHVT